MVTRRALIIGAAGGINSKFLPGVAVDISETKKFLMSASGGGWYEDEIIILEDATIEEIRWNMNFMYADFTMTIYTGHGFIDRLGNNCLTLSDGKYFYDTHLLNSSAKQIILVDACRKTIPLPIAGPPSIDGEYFDFEGGYHEKERARRAYDEWIENSESGKVIIHSTKYDTYAGDTANGGVFIQTLLKVGKTISTNNAINSYSIVAACKFALIALRSNGYSQTPTITYREGSIEMPFAIKLSPPKVTNKNTVVKQVIRPNYGGLFLTLGVIALIAIIAEN